MSQSTEAPVPHNAESPSSRDKHYPQDISVIENKGSGDVWQVMFSTGETIRGKNEGHGGRIRQLGGHGSDATAQQLSRNMLDFGLQNSEKESQESQNHETPVRGEALQLERLSDFPDRHGPGRSLSPTHSPVATASAARTDQSANLGKGYASR
jgi:hypothetical protein